MDSSLLSPTGLPPVAEEDKKRAPAKFITVLFFLPRAVFYAVAYAAYKFVSKTTADQSMVQLKSFNENIGCLYIAALIFSWMMWVLNFYAINWEPLVFAKDSGSLRTNMFVFKTLGSDKSTHVILDNDGPVGSYNRANRGLYHTLEYGPIFVVNFILAGPVFPKLVLGATVTYAVGRLLYQYGYAHVGWPKGSGPGFLLSNLLALNFLEGLTAVAALGLTGVL
mmetsp:Transcript_2144/g.4017  ORF Transcript_2144/g.4017 Transcript_2144/m.4017 type:complete len:223 (-) Transcript_2144:92-760(-)|eukprot:CAMPEP_0197635462 /NCGR_PEP_ID=MMETSP1338-20131121/11274_1 /TAXON_ID=43686 ORGANISM="Pelagodinium beii, Strain RCC1491" /NCGR_SAMPLE_ID=MMETSP1338 /ASSEMBLY_ACC=CAM_ASM_000754 /LENGTH=222 /DNA_ID=CAMNT_0043207515 /DNA_START=52 /DNA_END=720 /DNA_ORIENTATION=-